LTWWLNAKQPVAPREIDLEFRQLVLPCLASIFS